MPTVLILAAGLGSRFGGPKQLEPLGPTGETLLDYSLYDARRAGLHRAVLLIRPELRDAMERGVLEQWRRRMRIELLEQRLDDLPDGFFAPAERSRPWGTAHAVWCARHVIDEPFAVANADDCYGPAAWQVLGGFLRARADTERRYAIVGFPLTTTLPSHGPVNRAVLEFDEHGKLEGVDEVLGIERSGEDGRSAAGTISGRTLVSMNLWGFTPAVFPQLEGDLRHFLSHHRDDHALEHPLPTAMHRLIHAGEAMVDVMRAESRWCGVTHPDDRAPVAAFLHEQVSHGVYPSSLHS